MEITSPTILKLKGALFLVLGVLSAGIVLLHDFDLRKLVLYGISIWAFCRAYYFCFYVLHHYADPSFKYSGLCSVIRHLWKGRRRQG